MHHGIEGILVGFVTLIIGIIIDRFIIFCDITVNYKLEMILFLVGLSTKLIFEYFNLNSLYCKYGYANK